MSLAASAQLEGNANTSIRDRGRMLRRYRGLAKWLHWLTAALVMVLVAMGVIMKQLGEGPVADTLFNLHKLIGVLTLIVVLVRLSYRLTGLEPSAGASYRHPMVHWLLYAIIIAVPLLGWAGVSDYGAREIFFGYSLPAIWPVDAGYADILLKMHGYIAFAMLGLVALHIGNALHDYMTRARSDVPESEN